MPQHEEVLSPMLGDCERPKETVHAPPENYERCRQTFFEVRHRFIDRYTEAENEWRREGDFAAERREFFRRGNPLGRNDLCKLAYSPEVTLLYESDREPRSPIMNGQIIEELSELASDTLQAHRLLAQAFRNLPEEIKQTLRPQEICITQQVRDYFEKERIDIRGLIAGDAADNYLREAGLSKRWLHQKNIYNPQIQQYLISREEGLFKPQDRIERLVDDDEPLNHLHPVWDVYLQIKSQLIDLARDNGDNILWEVASRRLDPFVIADLTSDNFEKYPPFTLLSMR